MTLADRLILAAEQLELTSEQVHGITADDMRTVAKYLEPLAQHGYHVCAAALNAIDATDPGHPTRNATQGLDLQASLGHAMGLFDAVIHFAFDAQRAADDMAAGSAS